MCKPLTQFKHNKPTLNPTLNLGLMVWLGSTTCVAADKESQRRLFMQTVSQKGRVLNSFASYSTLGSELCLSKQLLLTSNSKLAKARIHPFITPYTVCAIESGTSTWTCFAANRFRIRSSRIRDASSAGLL